MNQHFWFTILITVFVNDILLLLCGHGCLSFRFFKPGFSINNFCVNLFRSPLMVKSKRKKRTALPGMSGLHDLPVFTTTYYILYEAFSDSDILVFCSPPHVKSEPDEDFYHSPKHEKSLKRERDDDNEWVAFVIRLLACLLHVYFRGLFIVVCDQICNTHLFFSSEFKPKKIKIENDKKAKKRKQDEEVSKGYKQNF